MPSVHVLVTTAARGADNSNTYHTDRDCPRLSNAVTVVSKLLENLTGYSHCRTCGGQHVRSPTDDDYSSYITLRDADPDTPLGGGV